MKITLLTYLGEQKFRIRDAEKLRGFLSNKYIADDRFHNHNSDGTLKYRMPVINYAVIDGNLSVIAYEEAGEAIIKEFFQSEEIKIGDELFNNFQRKIETFDEKFEVTDKLYSYKFKTTWLALNQDNYKNYKDGKIDLNKILRNHILANFIGFGIRVEKEIMVVGEFKQSIIEVKNQKMIGFLGEFKSNVKIPKHMTFGKRKSIGYGGVISID